MELEKWLNSGQYLPEALRDFHDQKDIFKTIHDTVNFKDNDYIKDVGFITGQCYVIDVFLWFMARRGYTLQRTRAKCEFRSLESDVAQNNERRSNQFVNAVLGGETK